MLKSQRTLPERFCVALRFVCTTRVAAAFATDHPWRFAGAVDGGVRL